MFKKVASLFQTLFGSNIRTQMLLNFAFQFLGIIMNFLFIFTVLEVLGSTNYGLYVSIVAINNWVLILDFGLSVGLRNKLISVLSKNKLESNETFSTAFYSLVFIVLIGLSAFFVLIFIFGLTNILNISTYVDNIELVIAFTVFIASVNLILQLSNTALYAVNKITRISLSTVVSKFIEIAILVVIFYGINVKINFIFFILFHTIIEFLRNLTMFWLTLKDTDLSFPRFSFFTFEKFRKLANIGYKIILIQIAAMFLNSTDYLLITKFFGASNVAPYSLSYQYFQLAFVFFSSFTAPLLIKYVKVYESNDLLLLRSIIKKLNLIIVFFALSILLARFPFIYIVKGYYSGKIQIPNSYIDLSMLYFILLIISSAYSQILVGLSKYNGITIVALFQAILNIPLSIYFSLNLNLGVNGIILGSICVIFISAVVSPILVFNYINQKTPLA